MVSISVVCFALALFTQKQLFGCADSEYPKWSAFLSAFSATPLAYLTKKTLSRHRQDTDQRVELHFSSSQPLAFFACSGKYLILLLSCLSWKTCPPSAALITAPFPREASDLRAARISIPGSTSCKALPSFLGSQLCWSNIFPKQSQHPPKWWPNMLKAVCFMECFTDAIFFSECFIPHIYTCIQEEARILIITLFIKSKQTNKMIFGLAPHTQAYISHHSADSLTEK